MSSTGFIDAVEKHVEKVIELCAHGESPLLADGVDLKTGEALVWEGQMLSNLACQQNFLRALDALGTLTGDEKYHKQADEWIGCALDKIHDETMPC